MENGIINAALLDQSLGNNPSSATLTSSVVPIHAPRTAATNTPPQSTEETRINPNSESQTAATNTLQNTEVTRINPNSERIWVSNQTLQVNMTSLPSERERLLQQNIAQLGRMAMEQRMQQRPSGHGHSHPHSHAHSHSHSTPVVPPTPPQVLPSRNQPPEQMVLDLEGIVSGGNPSPAPMTNNNNNQPEEAGGGGATGRARRARRQLGEQIQGVPGLGTIAHHLEGAVPFLLLLFAKVMYNHRLGLLVFVAMCGTFYYANTSLKKLIALRDNQSWSEALSGYLWVFGFMAANILFVYFVFSDQELYRCLYLQRPVIAELDLWNLMWVTIVTDFIIKFGTISVKSVVAILPKHLLLFRRKGKYFLLLETVSQCYRCSIPIPLWSSFLLEDRYGGQWVAVTLFVLYCVFKGMHIKKKLAELKKAFSQFRVDVSFGTAPSREEVKVFDDTCPICQDGFTEPVKLSCKHIFCDDCICLWLDREKTCPMCRAHIVDNPIWRDGATSAAIQFF